MEVFRYCLIGITICIAICVLTLIIYEHARSPGFYYNSWSTLVYLFPLNAIVLSVLCIVFKKTIAVAIIPIFQGACASLYSYDLYFPNVVFFIINTTELVLSILFVILFLIQNKKGKKSKSKSN